MRGRQAGGSSAPRALSAKRCRSFGSAGSAPGAAWASCTKPRYAV
jgi:hypothetical protein